MARVGRGGRVFAASVPVGRDSTPQKYHGWIITETLPEAFFFLEDSGKCQLPSIDLPVASKPQR